MSTTVKDLKVKYPTATLVKDWKELKNIPSESETHILEIEEYNGWIQCKKEREFNPEINYENQIPYVNHYLSTHTFYGNNFVHSTEILQKCGFNVIVDNWDDPTKN